MTLYDQFTTSLDLPAAVAALEVRDLARVISRSSKRDGFPELSTREIAERIIKEAARRTCTNAEL